MANSFPQPTPASPSAAAKSTSGRFSTTAVDGGSIVVELGYGIKLNERSSLHRKAYVINDSLAPLTLSDFTLSIGYKDRSYVVRTAGTASVNDNVSALEIRILLFDVFGEHLKTLSATSIADRRTGTSILTGNEDWSWFLSSTEAQDAMTSVAFVARARQASGGIWNFDEAAIIGELKKLSIARSAEELKVSIAKP